MTKLVIQCLSCDVSGVLPDKPECACGPWDVELLHSALLTESQIPQNWSKGDRRHVPRYLRSIGLLPKIEGTKG